MNSPFEFQIDFKNDYNWIYAFFVEFKICRHIDYVEDTVFTTKRNQTIYTRTVYFKKGI